MTNLKIYQLVDGVQTPFPNEDSQIEIFDYTYNAKRMGGAPSISATVKYASCLDDVWTESVYVEFNGEKYFLKQTPTSSYSNEEARYKHELEMVSERIILDNVYFFDVVSELEDYKPVTNSTKVVFFGTIKEFVARLNQSLRYSKLQTGDVLAPQGYKVVIDNGITSESKLITFEDQFFSGVLQEIFNVYELPYYFEGKTIHIGFETQGAVLPTFQYGIDNELLSITKTNANNKIVNRVTGVGSADNIPYYYPNMSEKGNFKAVYYTVDENGAVNAQNDYVRITSSYRYGKSVETGTGLIYTKETSSSNWATEHKTGYSVSATSTIDKPSFKSFNNGNTLYLNFPNVSTAIWITIQRTLHIAKKGKIEIPIEIIQYDNNNQGINKADSIREIKLYDLDNNDSYVEAYVKNNKIIIENAPENNTSYYLQILYGVQYMGYTTSYSGKDYKVKINISDPIGKSKTYWLDEKNKKTYTKLQDVGLMLNEGVEPQVDDKIIQEKSERYIQPQETLMPPIYREEFGAERFYNAVNGEYKDEDNNDIIFDNPYIDGKPKEQIVEFSDIKPTIKGMTNRQGLRIDMFSEFAYDDDDNDETEEIEGTIHHKHPYFFAKLRKTDGEHAFNIFDSAIDEGEMTISMTSGHCGGCNFKVMVSDDDLKQNLVQVYEQDETDQNGVFHPAGSLKRDENGNVICGRKPYQAAATGQNRQQNTIYNEVWIALEKDLESYGTMMPSCVVTETNSGNGGFNPELPPIDSPLEKADLMTTGTESETIETVIRPSVDDTFVILHINLPQAYIEYAEERLEKEIIKYMAENNKEKFTFSIKFSRIYLAQNPAIANAINENALLNIMYDGKTYPLYVSSYTYKVDSNTALPEITVELKDEITVNQNAMQKAITEVKGDFLTAFENLDIIGLCGPHFLRKDVDDRSAGKISASMGFEAGSYTKGRSGAKIDEYGQAEFESVAVRDKVVVNEISTENYLSGSLGSGAKLWVDENNKANLEIDNLIARESLKVTELIIQKVNSVGGLLVVSAANGEIKEIATNFDDATNGEIKIKSYTVTLNEDATFENDDIIRCSFWDNEIEDDNKLRTYWVAIKVADSTKKNVITIPATYTNSNNETVVVRPKVGDKIAQMGNTTNTSRQGVIVISTENNKPFISIYDGVNTNALDASKLRGRFGDLSGITFNGEELNGYGIWSNNAYLNGKFRIESTGKTIEDEINSQITNDASSRNYARMTAVPANITDISIETNVTRRIYDVYGFTNGDTLTVSFDWEAKGIDFITPDSFISMQFSDSYGYISAGFRLKSSNITPDVVNKGTHTHTLTLQGKWDSNSQTASLPISKSDNGWLYLRFDNVAILNGYGYLKISNLRVNKGKISHDWEVALEDANAELNAYKEVVTQELNTLQSQIDGQVESWFYDYSPTTDNLPASQWTTDALKEAHIGDTFTNTQEYVDDTNTPDAGKSWRWLNKDGVYGWYPISDSDATKALLLASQAKDTADNKRRVFVSTPTPPYDEGDLWVNATYGDYTDEILKCVTPKANGASFNIDDWTKASNYTDDSALQAFIGGDFESEISNLQTQIDGKAETWYQPSDPSSKWNTDTLKQLHTGDMWYNTTTNTTHRWNGSSWDAQDIPKSVFDVIDGKAQIFVSQPSTPYYIGDIWTEGENGDIYRCIANRTIGDFSQSDWEKASKYTDDSATTQLRNEVKSQFEVVAGKFTSVQSAIVNNASQGRNILLGTNQGVKNWNLGTNLDKPTYYIIGEESYNDAKGVKFSKYDSANFAQWEVFFYPLRPQFITKDKEYRLSFDAKFANIDTNNTKIGIMLVDRDGRDSSRLTNYGYINITIDGQWQHYDIPLTAIKNGEIDGTQVLYIYILDVRTTFWGSASFANLKLEEATIATPWSPAPEDAEESIKASETVLKSEIKQTADAISLKIKETEYFTTSNLIVGSYKKFENKDYLLATYNLADVKPNHGDIVTLSFSGKIEDIQGSFAIYNSGGNVYLARIYASNGFNETTQRYEITFTWLTEREDGVTAPNTDIRIYQGANAGAVGSFEKPSIIYDVMLTRTDKPVAYKPTPTDVEDKLKDTGIDIESKKITVTADNFQVQNNEGDTTLAVDEKGNLVTNTLQAIGADGNPLISANVNSSGFLTFYYPNTNQKQMEMGWDAGTASLMRYYDDLGNMLWKIGSERGFVAPTSNLIIVEKQYWLVGTLEEISARDAYLAVTHGGALNRTPVYGQRTTGDPYLLNFYYDAFLSRPISGYLADVEDTEYEDGRLFKALRKIENGEMTKSVTVWHGDTAYDIPEDWLN